MGQLKQGDQVYDCVVIGAGISGLACANSLVENHGFKREKVLVLEAQSYAGGRIHQDKQFVKGVNVELGAEILHGECTSVVSYARKLNEPMEKIFCLAQGDGKPILEESNGQYGLYVICKGQNKRIIRFDDCDADFMHVNKLLWEISDIDLSTITDDTSLEDYLEANNVTTDMLDLANAGYANTMCSSSSTLSLKHLNFWETYWETEPDADINFRLRNSYSVIINDLKSKVKVRVNTAVRTVRMLPQNDTVEVVCASGRLIKARTVVVSCPPPAMQDRLITFEPELPPERLVALHSLVSRSALKIMLKFRERCWPEKLYGMIMSGCDIPEVWFRDVTEQVKEYNAGVTEVDREEANFMCTGFVTADYADNLSKLSQEEVVEKFLDQLESIFSAFEGRHMYDDNCKVFSPLISVRSAFLGGIIHRWDREHHPFIGGGYASGLAGRPAGAAFELSKPLHERIFFCGEHTNVGAGASTHSAFDTGIRAADEVSTRLLTRRQL